MTIATLVLALREAEHITVSIALIHKQQSVIEIITSLLSLDFGGLVCRSHSRVSFVSSLSNYDRERNEQARDNNKNAEIRLLVLYASTEVIAIVRRSAKDARRTASHCDYGQHDTAGHLQYGTILYAQ